MEIITSTGVGVPVINKLSSGEWIQVAALEKVFYCRILHCEKDRNYNIFNASIGPFPPVSLDKKLMDTNLNDIKQDISCISRDKTSKEAEKVAEKLIIRPFTAKILPCSIIILECKRKLDECDLESIKSFAMGFVIRDSCSLNLHPLMDQVLYIVQAIPNVGGEGVDCFITPKTEFKYSSPPSTTSVNNFTENDTLSSHFLDPCAPQLLDIVSTISHLPKSIQKLGIDIPKGILLHGPPGVGKTSMVVQIAKQCNIPIVSLSSSELGSNHNEQLQLRDKFQQAREISLELDKPVIVFLDEIDSIAPSRSLAPQGTKMVAQLLTLMDGVEARGRLIVIGATNRPNYIDPALRRPGRFDREIQIDIPNQDRRLEVLKGLVENIPHENEMCLESLASKTNGYVTADLVALVREACLIAVKSNSKHLTSDILEKALLGIGAPSLLRSSQIGVEKKDWSQLGGVSAVKQILQQAIEWPLKRKQVFARLGITPPRGVLLYGPPGCSKTTMAKIIASQSGLNFFSMTGASVYSSYLGESEQSIRTLFKTARSASPSIIFFDEIDAIVGKRGLGSNTTSGDSVQERVLSTFLNEMDGIEQSKDVVVVGATNRPDMIDAALMRPGRFDKIVYVSAPNQQDRLEILQIYTRGMPMDKNVDLVDLSKRTDRFTGADLSGLCREAALLSIRRLQSQKMDPATMSQQFVEKRDFEVALDEIKPTLSREMIDQYTKFSKMFGI